MADLITPSTPLANCTPPPSPLPLFVPHVTPEPHPLFCRLQGLGVTSSRTPTPQTLCPPYRTAPVFGGEKK